MNIPLDAALFDLEKRLSSEELPELPVCFIYSVSSHSKPKKSLQGVVLQQRTTRRAAILASQETRIYRCRNFWFWGGQGTTASIYLHMGGLGKPPNSDILCNELENFVAPHRQLPALSKDVSHHAGPVQSTSCSDITWKVFNSQTQESGESQRQQHAHFPLCVAK